MSRQAPRVCSLPAPCPSWGSDLSTQIWQQEPLPTAASAHWSFLIWCACMSRACVHVYIECVCVCACVVYMLVGIGSLFFCHVGLQGLRGSNNHSRRTGLGSRCRHLLRLVASPLKKYLCTLVVCIYVDEVCMCRSVSGGQRTTSGSHMTLPTRKSRDQAGVIKPAHPGLSRAKPFHGFCFYKQT